MVPEQGIMGASRLLCKRLATFLLIRRGQLQGIPRLFL
jgi:hypothetical protein